MVDWGLTVFDESMDEPSTNSDGQENSGEQRPHFEFLPEEELLEEARRIQDPTYDDPAYFSAPTPPPPPPGVAPSYVVTPEDRLVRDPFTTLGGVLSGIGHRYGWDVSFLRIMFILFVFLSGGTAIAAYLLSWLIIPRARIWPPLTSARTPGGGVAPRDLGIGLFALVAILVIAGGFGGAAGIIVPILLVAGGIWLLTQSPRAIEAPVQLQAHVGYPVAPVAPTIAPVAPTTTTTTTSFSTIGSAAPHPQPPAPPQSYPPAPPPFPGSGALPPQGQLPPQPLPPQPQAPLPSAPQVVPPRSGGRKLAIGVAVLAIAGIVVLPVVAVVGVVAFASGDGFVDDESTIIFTPSSADDLPNVIEGEGLHIVDLRGIDFDEVEDRPVELSVDVDAGRIEVLLQDDVSFNIDASVDTGEIVVATEDGARELGGVLNEFSSSVEDPDLDLDLDVGFGSIEVISTSDQAGVR